MKKKLLIFKDKRINLKNTIYILMLIMVISGICGFIYETFFYRIDLGYFSKRGSTFGPWIPIYGWGGLFITIIAYRFKEKPLVVFLVSCIVTGLLEYLTGYVLLNCFNIRLWDYNNEMLNFGNINGFICFRSILLFGLAGLLLIYKIIPLLIKFVRNTNKKTIEIFSISLWLMFIFDIIIYIILK